MQLPRGNGLTNYRGPFQAFQRFHRFPSASLRTGASFKTLQTKVRSRFNGSKFKGNPVGVQNVQAVQPQPEADQPLAELLHAPFKSFWGTSTFPEFSKRQNEKRRLYRSEGSFLTRTPIFSSLCSGGAISWGEGGK